MIAALKRQVAAIWNSIVFRLALHYSMLLLLVLVVVLTILYTQTVGVMQRRIDQQLEYNAYRLQQHFEQYGQDALSRDISRMLEDGVSSDSEIYALWDDRQRPVAGNVTDPVLLDLPQERITEIPVYHHNGRSLSRVVVRRLSDGSTLAVGHDMRDQRALETLIAEASLSAGAIALLLTVGGTLMFRQLLEARVAAIRRTAARIEAGDLSQRIPVSPQDDEFARLTRDINLMLDQIERLMDGVRHVSNTIAHNLRTPLSRMLVRLRTAEHDPAQRDEAIRFVIGEIEDLSIVFDKLLQIAEVESGARRQAFSEVDINTLVLDVLDLYSAVAEEQDASLTHSLSPDVVLHGDRDLLASATANLVDNALKYAGRHAHVHVTTRQSDDHVTIAVQDNGAGIPAHERERVGTRFYRLDRQAPGYGLGLASVIAIAQLHGGTLRLTDAAPGLVATLDLPAKKGA
ncbi:MAG TPA: HAMP domain-containing sensor histidine kinase [Burkholderiaceae bacterium]|jgi:signal transduction histidine kinase|nr:HAMP domain-containing sensor histidine kinase [Burkholderiaceae bacterium]